MVAGPAFCYGLWVRSAVRPPMALDGRLSGSQPGTQGRAVEQPELTVDDMRLPPTRHQLILGDARRMSRVDDQAMSTHFLTLRVMRQLAANQRMASAPSPVRSCRVRHIGSLFRSEDHRAALLVGGRNGECHASPS